MRNLLRAKWPRGEMRWSFLSYFSYRVLLLSRSLAQLFFEMEIEFFLIEGIQGISNFKLSNSRRQSHTREFLNNFQLFCSSLSLNPLLYK